MPAQAPANSKPLPAGSINIISAEISSAISGKTMDVKGIIQEFNVFEDLLQPFITMNVILVDALALTTWFPFTGHEFITIQFETPHPAFLKKVQLNMSIIAVEDMKSSNLRTEVYLLRCVPTENILDWNTRIRKSYRQMPVSEMATKVAEEFLGIAGVEATESDGVRTIVIPNMNPTRALNFLCREAMSSVYQPSNYLFYQNADGFFFRPIEQMIQSRERGRGRSDGRPTDKYYATDMDMGNRVDERQAGGPMITSDKPFDFIKMLQFKFLNLFDNRKTLIAGGFESTTRLIDPTISLYEERKYDYFEDFRKFNHTTTTTANHLISQRSNPYISKYQSRIDFIPDNHISNQSNVDTKPEVIHYRNASFALLNNLVVNVTIPGDSEKRIGDVVDLQFPEFGATDDVIGEVNYFISGEYLVTAVRHIYNGNGYHTVMRCVKNAYQKDIEIGRNTKTPISNLPSTTGTQQNG